MLMLDSEALGCADFKSSQAFGPQLPCNLRLRGVSLVIYNLEIDRMEVVLTSGREVHVDHASCDVFAQVIVLHEDFEKVGLTAEETRHVDN